MMVVTMLLMSACGKEAEESIDSTHAEENIETNTENSKEQNKSSIDTTLENTNTSTNWSEFKLYANGKNFTLPCTYKEFSGVTGLKMDEDYLSSYFKMSSKNLDMYANSGDSFGSVLIFMNNDKGENTLYTDGTVYNVIQYKEQTEMYNAAKIVFPGNLYVGKEITENDLVELFGEPTVRWENERNPLEYKYNYLINYDSVTGTGKAYRITVEDGNIISLELENRDYK